LPLFVSCEKKWRLACSKADVFGGGNPLEAMFPLNFKSGFTFLQRWKYHGQKEDSKGIYMFSLDLCFFPEFIAPTYAGPMATYFLSSTCVYMCFSVSVLSPFMFDKIFPLISEF
jgi:hypothetical protein